MTEPGTHTAGWKAKLAEELKLLGVVGLYIFLTLTAVDMYKRVAMRGELVEGFQLGYNAIEALILAKVIILGDLLKISHKFRDRPLILPTLFRAFIFALFIMAFSSLELFIRELIHGAGTARAFEAMLEKEQGIRVTHAAVMFLTGIPLYAAWELSRVLGEGKLARIFFRDRTAAG